MTRAVPQHWLLFAGPGDTGLAVQLEPVMSKNGVTLSFTPGPIGERLDIELETSENDNSPLTDAYRDLENSARNGGGCGYALLQSEDHLRCEATFRFQFEKKYLNGDVLQNVSGASADLLFGLAVVTAVRSDLEYRPFAATGILSEDRQVQPIEGLQAKIRAALNTPALRGSGVIFYPKANDKDIDAELRYEVERAQIALKPVEWLEEAVECLGIPIQGTWLGNPYRRLDVFEYSHRRIYFGRENEADYLADKLFERAKLSRPSLLILGPSGGGKSSLVQAGLIPELEKRLNDRNLSLLYSIFDLKSAANKDVYAIAASIRSSWGLLPGLAALAVNSSQELQTAMTPSDAFASLISDLITYLPDQTRFVWILDQLEQFFSLGLNEEAIAAFIHLLRELQARGIWIVATFRNDFYSALKAHDRISSIFDKDGIHDLENLSETTIERIIQNPAKLAKLEFEKDVQKSELLSLKLKNDALKGGKDILPLVEFALDQLYEKRELKDGRTQLTWAAYEAMGSLQGAIGSRADEVLSNLDQAAQATLGRVLRALAKLRRDSVETESGKSPFIASGANLENFPPDTPARCLIDAFAEARLFVGDRDNDDIAQVRVTHEALFTHWSKARKILDESMIDMVLRDRLADREADWKLNEKHASKLLPIGLPLEEAQDLLARRRDEKFLSPEIIHFIEQSSSADQERKLKESEAQRRKTRLTTITAIVLGILLVVAIGAFYYVNQARNEQAQMLASSYFSEGARFVDEGRSKEALAYLAQAMRLDSDPNTPAARLAASILLSPKYRININILRIQCRYGVNTAQFSPDGRWVLANCDHAAQVWDASSGEPVSKPMQHDGTVSSVQFSPDGRWVVTSSWDKSARIWEAATGHPVSKPMQHSDFVQLAQFSPDSRLVITTSWDQTVWVWEAATGKLMSKLMKYNWIVKSAQFSPNSRWVVTASEDKSAQIWEAVTGTQVSKPIRHGDIVQSAQFSPDGRWVVTASNDKTARVWEAATGKPVSEPMQHEGAVISAQFSPDGRWVVTASKDKTARVWEAATGQPVSSFIDHGNEVNSIQFSPDGRWVVTTYKNKTTWIWEAVTGVPISRIQHEETVSTAQFSQDGRRVVTASEDNTVRVWEVATKATVLQSIQYGNDVNLAQFSPDSRWMVTASNDKTARVWDVTTGEPVSELIHHEGKISSAQFSPDGRWVVTASKDNTARVWEAATGAPVSKPMQHKDFVQLAQFSPDGRWVATASEDNTARVWEAATGAPVSEPMQHDGTVSAIQFSSDSRWVLTASLDRTARIWEAETGASTSKIMQHGSGVNSAQFSPDGRWIITADGHWLTPITSEYAAWMWEVDTGTLIFPPIQHRKSVHSARFSPDGRWVATASEDNTARVWEAANGAPVSQSMTHASSVNSAQFSPDSRWVITASWDGTARIWESLTGKPASLAFEHEYQVKMAQFSSDGSHILTVSDAAYVSEIPRLPQIGTEFIKFLERVSRYSINSKNVLQLEYHDLTLNELRNWAITTNNLTQQEREFIDWWLSDPIERTVTPTNKQTVKGRVQVLIDRDTIVSLNEALDYYPGHPMALAKLAAATWREAKSDQQDGIRPRVSLWANLALKYTPDDTAVRTVAKKVLQDIAQPN